MPLGPALRRLLGPIERPVADAYRRFFVDLDQLAGQIRRWVPAPRLILEVGCGEGAVIGRLVHLYPDAHITGIDVSPAVGRLYAGPRTRVEFRCQTLAAFAAGAPPSIDLILIADIMHHVPVPLRRGLLSDAHALLSSGGVLVFKDWARTRSLAHWLCYASDRYITGDAVSYGTAGEFRGMIESEFGAGSIRDEALIRPWRNNFAFLVRP